MGRRFWKPRTKRANPPRTLVEAAAHDRVASQHEGFANSCRAAGDEEEAANHESIAAGERAEAQRLRQVYRNKAHKVAL